MPHLLDAVVVGAGQAGLAASHLLAERGLDHVVLERGAVGERWRSERWDSLHLLTPNWLTDLPGRPTPEADPERFRSRTEVVELLADYGASAPVAGGAAVTRLRTVADHYEVTTAAGTWVARNVVLATGWCDRPAVPPVPAIEPDPPACTPVPALPPLVVSSPPLPWNLSSVRGLSNSA